jgi:hypothetical protein
MATYEVYLNYPSHTKDTDGGRVVSFSHDHLKSYKTRDEAIAFAKSHSLRPRDYIYVYQRDSGQKGSDHSIFYRNTPQQREKK